MDSLLEDDITGKARLAALKSNMQIVQLCVEDWSTQSDGIYPAVLDRTIGNKNTLQNMVVDNFKIKNPYNNADLPIILSLKDPPDWGQVKDGQVIYVPLFNNNTVASYKIYGKSDSGPLSLVLKSGE